MTDRHASPPRHHLALPLGIVLALAVVLSAYYFVHKPLQPRQAAVWFSTLADVAVVLLLTALGGGIGRRLLRGWTHPSAGERITVELALGWGFAGMLMLGLGLVNLYSRILLWPLSLIALGLLRRDVRAWLADFRAALRGLVFPDRLSRFGGLFVLFTFGLGLLTALAPPLMWDALVYHLTLPRLYAQTHGLRLNGDFFFSGMPQMAEMLYTAALLLHSPIAAQALGWMFGAALALGLAAHAHEVFAPSAPAGMLASAILFSSLTVALSLSWAYADLLLMLFSLACLIALRQWRTGGEARWLWLAAVLAGFAAGCKYTGVLVPLAGSAVILLTLVENRGDRSQKNHPVTLSPRRLVTLSPRHLDTPSPCHPVTLSPRRLVTLSPRHLVTPSPCHLVTPSPCHPVPRHLVTFPILSLLIFTPWLLKNWLFTGSPVYPLFFPAGYVDALRLQFYNQPDLADRNPLWAALIFFRATFLGVQGGDPYDATLGPLFVILWFGLTIGWRRLEAQRRVELRPLAVFALVSYLGWVSLTFVSYYAVQARLFFAIFPALALLCAGGLAALAAFDSPTLRLSLIVNAAVAFVLVLSALEYGLAFVAHNPLAYLAGAQSAADYRAANLGWYAAAMERVNQLPAGSRVVFLWEPRSLECVEPSRCDPDVIIDRWWHLRRQGKTPAEAIAAWKARSATHVLIYEAGVRFLRENRDHRFAESDWGALDDLRGQMRLIETFGEDYSLYALP